MQFYCQKKKCYVGNKRAVRKCVNLNISKFGRVCHYLLVILKMSDYLEGGGDHVIADVHRVSQDLRVLPHNERGVH